MFKSKGRLISVISIILLFMLMIAGVGYWLPQLINRLLPTGISMDFGARPFWGHGHFNVIQWELRAQGCPVATINTLSVGYRLSSFEIKADELQLHPSCFRAWPHPDHSASPVRLSQLQSLLPAINVSINKINGGIADGYQGRLSLQLNKQQHALHYHSPDLQLAAHLNGARLNIDEVKWRTADGGMQLSLQGHTDISETQIIHRPLQGNFSGQLQGQSLPSPLQITLTWQDKKGVLQLQGEAEQARVPPQLKLPFTLTENALHIDQGQWQWSDATHRLQGGIQLAITELQQGWQQALIHGRVNILTQGKGGKGNIVLSFGPGRLDFQQNALPLRLTGEAKLADLQLYASLPAQLQGALLSPHLRFLPGALLRARGMVLPQWQVDEARWPLSGVSVDFNGVQGPLQARLILRNQHKGFYQLNLAGQAQHFLPDKGQWNWKYWGKGQLRPLHANWTITGRGFWHDKLITLSSMQTGFDNIDYQGLRIRQPRLQLIKPITWLTDHTHPQFAGKIRLDAGKSDFGRVSELAPAQAEIEFYGTNPQQFTWRAMLTAGPVGPISVQGRRDHAHWRGRAWWPMQSLSVFQSLLSPKREQIIRAGQLKAQLAFSVTDKDGFHGGGHFVVTDGEIWTPTHLLRGIHFSLPFNYQRNYWLFGKKSPVQLRIDSISNRITLKNITADLQGYYPYNDRHPLFLTHTGMRLFGGSATLTTLRLPQHQPTILKFERIELRRLIQLLEPGLVDLSGTISAELPLWLTGQGGFYTDMGWLKNQGPLRLRLAQSARQHLNQQNRLAKMGIAWLQTMEISALSAKIRVAPNGEMDLSAIIEGNSQRDKKQQRIRLNYRQQENLLQLWRSLNFSSNLSSWIQQHGSDPSK